MHAITAEAGERSIVPQTSFFDRAHNAVKTVAAYVTERNKGVKNAISSSDAMSAQHSNNQKTTGVDLKGTNNNQQVQYNEVTGIFNAVDTKNLDQYRNSKGEVILPEGEGYRPPWTRQSHALYPTVDEYII